MATLSSETTTRLDCHDQDQVSIFQHPDGGRAYFGLVTRDDGALVQVLAHVAHYW
jgi:hypothetical protein